MPEINKHSLPIGQKGIAHLFLIVLLLAGIGLGVYLVNQKTNLFPWAASNPISGPVTPPSPFMTPLVASAACVMHEGFSNKHMDITIEANNNLPAIGSDTQYIVVTDTQTNESVVGAISPQVNVISNSVFHERISTLRGPFTILDLIGDGRIYKIAVYYAPYTAADMPALNNLKAQTTVSLNNCVAAPSPSPSPTPTSLPTPCPSGTTIIYGDPQNGGTAIIKCVPIPTPTPTSIPIPKNFTGEYFSNKNLSGIPKFTRNDAEIKFNWDNSAPAAVIPRDKFSVRWTKQESFKAGKYRFTVRNDDGMRIYIDGKRVYNRWEEQSAKTRTFNTSIKEGIHTIKVEYYENKGRAEAQVSWKKL